MNTQTFQACIGQTIQEVKAASVFFISQLTWHDKCHGKY